MSFPDHSSLRKHQYLGMTQSLCPECLQLIQAKIISKQGRVYFVKHCPDHGIREDFVCSDESWFDRNDFNVPGKIPVEFGIEPSLGCPYDCGLCTEHEQHTCVAVLEVTDSCNLTCPMCYASSAPRGKHLSVEECQLAIDRLVEVEGKPEILQLSGGEPTVHPDFHRIYEYACRQPIDHVMVNTNGIRLAKDDSLIELLAEHHDKSHVYFQMDGLSEKIHPVLRGENLLDVKLRSLERLGQAGIHTTLVVTIQTGVNLNQLGPLFEFARERSWVTGMSLQPATYVGRSFEPENLVDRVTFPDVIREMELQTNGQVCESDFFPVPCAHPNAHTLCYGFRNGSKITPITRFIDVQKHHDLLANGISLTRDQAKLIIEAYLARESCGTDCSRVVSEANSMEPMPAELSVASSFFANAMEREIAATDMFRITTTSFMDAYNFDIRQLVKSCVHHILPSGHIIPFDAYNLLYRNGHVALPALRQESVAVTRIGHE